MASEDLLDKALPHLRKRSRDRWSVCVCVCATTAVGSGEGVRWPHRDLDHKPGGGWTPRITPLEATSYNSSNGRSMKVLVLVIHWGRLTWNQCKMM